MFAENGKIQGSLVDMMESLASQVRLTADFSMQPAAETLPLCWSNGLLESWNKKGLRQLSITIILIMLIIMINMVMGATAS